MLEGLTLVSSEVVPIMGTIFGWNTLGAICFAIAIASLIFGIAMALDDMEAMWVLLGGAVAALFLLFWSTACWQKEPIAEETYYKVLIDDSVNFNEFNNKYQLIGREGDIYEIVEWSEDNPRPNQESYIPTEEDE